MYVSLYTIHDNDNFVLTSHNPGLDIGDELQRAGRRAVPRGLGQLSGARDACARERRRRRRARHVQRQQTRHVTSSPVCAICATRTHCSSARKNSAGQHGWPFGWWYWRMVRGASTADPPILSCALNDSRMLICFLTLPIWSCSACRAGRALHAFTASACLKSTVASRRTITSPSGYGLHSL